MRKSSILSAICHGGFFFVFFNWVKLQIKCEYYRNKKVGKIISIGVHKDLTRDSAAIIMG